MKINRITITGADDVTPVNALRYLSAKYPFVEWGILFSPKRVGTNRYPSLDWIRKLVADEPRLKLSAHLCGRYPRNLLQNGALEVDIAELVTLYFQRAQINFNFANTEWNSQHLLKLLKNTDTQHILQMNKFNEEVIKTVESTENFDVLYDASGGRGTEIKSILSPFEKHYTGYSGGLTPDNIGEFCEDIIAYPSDASVFIDCETGVRDSNDQFDLTKVEKYLEICSKYVVKH
jgi:phosphoribosylanthranilate isomerase